MFSTHRHARCQAILHTLPSFDSPKPGHSMRELLGLLAEYYRGCTSDAAQVRVLQNDLKFLRNAQEIVCDPKTGEGTTLRYRRAAQEQLPAGNLNLDHLYQDLLQRGIAYDLAHDFVQRVRQHPRSYYDLPPEQLVTVADSVRLTAKKLPDATVQDEILRALQQGRVLKASYRKLEAPQAEERFLHPLGVLLRGPQHYLIAYDAKDLQQASPPAKMFLIQRLEDALMLEDSPSRLPTEASVVQLVREQGLADFVRDPKPVQLKLRVWDYVLRLLEEHQITPNQTLRREADGESAIVTAKVMPSGTLYRWLLGFGDKVEVLKPKSLRHAIAWQANSVTEYYKDIYEATEEDNSKNNKH